jgi:hypothetical protein
VPLELVVFKARMLRKGGGQSLNQIMLVWSALERALAAIGIIYKVSFPSTLCPINTRL